MPQTRVLLYQESNGSVPLKEWLEELRRRDRRGFAKCVERIERLAALGHELRRPHADMLRDGIFELRARRGSVNYRILYFFHGRGIAVLCLGLTKERAVPAEEIERATERRDAFLRNPTAHTYQEDDDGEESQDE